VEHHQRIFVVLTPGPGLCDAVGMFKPDDQPAGAVMIRKKGISVAPSLGIGSSKGAALL
jgi:hypothetical protein